MYDFNAQLSIGKLAEDALDRYFSKWYTITPVSLAQELTKGIDRIFDGKNGRRTIEYKADYKAIETGNAYLEYEVNSDNGKFKAGWVEGSLADYVIYAVVANRVITQIYVLQPQVLRDNLPIWKEQYRIVKCHNNGYHSVGVIVPLRQLREVALTAFWCDQRIDNVGEMFDKHKMT